MSAFAFISGAVEQISFRLVVWLQSDRIYLFGPQASGQATGESDYDLLVVVPESNLPRHQREAHSYDLLWGLTTPVDVIVLTREEFNRTSQVKTPLASTVQERGEVVNDGAWCENRRDLRLASESFRRFAISEFIQIPPSWCFHSRRRILRVSPTINGLIRELFSFYSRIPYLYWTNVLIMV